MNKIIAWLDMYRICLKKYFQDLSLGIKAEDAVSHNPELLSAFQLYKSDPANIVCSGAITGLPPTLSMKVGETIMIPYTVAGDYSSQILTHTATKPGVNVKIQDGYLILENYAIEETTITFTTLDDEESETIVLTPEFDAVYSVKVSDDDGDDDVQEINLVVDAPETKFYILVDPDDLDEIQVTRYSAPGILIGGVAGYVKGQDTEIELGLTDGAVEGGQSVEIYVKWVGGKEKTITIPVNPLM